MCPDQVDVWRLGFVFSNFPDHVAVLRLRLAGLGWLQASVLELTQAPIGARLYYLGLIILVLNALVLSLSCVLAEVETLWLASAPQRRPV